MRNQTNLKLLQLCAALLVGALAVLSPPSAAAEPSAPPGALYADADHVAHLRAYAARRAAAGDAYNPRTNLRGDDGAPLYLNRMILEASPYLRQHAHNPVDWRPWGPEALAEAHESGKLIFLSIGYATCHWCHVMEEESFDTLSVAQVLNRDYVPIKVDREERPAVDETYSLAALIINGASGWPNNLWLTPGGEPLFAATYLPKPELEAALGSIHSAWREQPEFARTAAAQITQALRNYATHRDASAKVDEPVYQAAQQALAAEFNELSGGFSDSVQFPMEVNLHFLLDRWRRTGDAAALEMATTTLDGLLAGGVHDHAGGGFHRYAVDPEWAVPHFEKMLYNQAEIARALIAAWQATGRAAYRRAAERALDYALREMRAPSGAFFAAEDADSLSPETGETSEGAFYLWREESLGAVLGDKAQTVGAQLGVAGPPLLEEGSPLRVSPEEIDALPALDPALEALRKARGARPKPLRDEKIIAGWNGLMVRALAEAAGAFQRPDYAEAARRAADAVWSALWRGDRLLRFTEGGAGAPNDARAALEDYAWAGLGYLALWDLTGDETTLQRAKVLAETALERFASGQSGRLKMSEQDGPLGPILQQSDGSVPAGESSMLELMTRLARREQALTMRAAAEKLMAALSGGFVARPTERLTALRAAALLQSGEVAPKRALSNGAIRAEARRSGDRLELSLNLAPGWHVNADRPLQDYLIATALNGDAVVSVDYPPAHEIALGFSETPLAVLEGDATLVARLDPAAADAPITVSLQVQACSDEQCLAPETAAFRLGPAPR